MLIDTQRQCALVATRSKSALQYNMAKPQGGFRPITFLEESLKAIEGLVARRRRLARRPLRDGTVYCAANQAGESGRQAASAVLYLDTLVCEDSVANGLALSRVPSDYEKFFNTIQLPIVDAVDACRGIPSPARSLTAEAMSGITVRVITRWGLSPGIPLLSGVAQGSISGPELASPAQEPILRAREASPAAYTSSAGRRITCSGYVDDAEHYGAGARHLPIIMSELQAGSLASGIGFSWPKFSAFATDWSEFVANSNAADVGMTEQGIRAAGWDIWRGGLAADMVPRAYGDSIEKLLGKRGSINDKHTAARTDLMSKLCSTRKALVWRRATWDEISTAVQLHARGTINYCPLVGCPTACDRFHLYIALIFS